MIRKNYKNAKNNAAINNFLGAAVGAVTSASLRAMQKVAQRGVDNLVNNVAQFSDYTGVLINSYQAAILVNGNFDSVGKWTYLNEFRNAKRSIRMITSYHTNGTTPISFKTIDNKGTSFARRKQRNPNSKPTIKNRYQRKATGNMYKGYGRDLTTVRTHTPMSSLGIEVVFSNPTPYANHVAEQNAGSIVMPVGVAAINLPVGTVVAITDSEIFRAVNRAKKYIKR